jgi:dienelactone hydrolase
MHATLRALLLSMPLACACAGDPLEDDALAESELALAPAFDFAQPGPYTVGTTRITMASSATRTVPVQIWYPAPESARAEAVSGHFAREFEPAGSAERTKLEALYGSIGHYCTRKVMHAAIDAPVRVLDAPFPLLVFSHCLDGARFEMASAAEHLASYGFVVAAPDHVGGTLYNPPTSVTSSFLHTRAADVRAVIDGMLGASNAPALPAALRGRIDVSRIGAFGHSYGSATTGLVLETDARVRAGAMIAGPVDTYLLDDAHLSRLTKPGLFFEAMEDNSIGLAGNALLESNYTYYPAPAWGVRLKDGGHWSFTDFAGLNARLTPGCGSAKRQTNPFVSFNYAPIEPSRQLTQAYLAAFFSAQLRGDAAGTAYLGTATPSEWVSVLSHP